MARRRPYGQCQHSDFMSPPRPPLRAEHHSYDPCARPVSFINRYRVSHTTRGPGFGTLLELHQDIHPLVIVVEVVDVVDHQDERLARALRVTQCDLFKLVESC